MRALDLHSSMERLKGFKALYLSVISKFTFQYGEIKRARGGTNLSIVSVFTFQYGEIKSFTVCI